MYRGEKKNPPSPASIISRVFQVSWFPKLKPKKGTRKQQSPPLPAVHRREGRFYSTADDDDGAYWRLSFRTEDRKSIIGIPIPRSREKEEKQYKGRIVHNHERRLSRKKELGRGTEDDGKLQPLPLKPVMEKYIFPIGTPVSNSRIFTLMSSVNEDYASWGSLSNSKGRNSDKVNDENEFRAEPVCMISGKSRHRRIKPTSNSPKREFRVRVLEGRKKERARSKKETKEQMADGTTAYDSFAEAKTSFDPQKDFRDSMVEMICEKGIRRREELEDLLACYLMLNRDHYHDLIIRVFRQVWFELRAY